MTRTRTTLAAFAGTTLLGLGLAGNAAMAGAAPQQSSQPARAAATGWTTVFSDEFARADAGGGNWINLERTTPIEKCAKTIDDPTQAGADKVLRVNPQPFPTTSSPSCRFTTAAVFGAAPNDGKTYRFTARIKLPTTQGHYASFWFNGVPYNEVDIVESFGTRAKPSATLCAPGPNQTSNTNEFRGVQTNYYSDVNKSGRRYCWTGTDMSGFKPLGRWHVYSAVWNPGNGLTIRVDGRLLTRFDAAYAKPGAVRAILTDIDNDDNNAFREGMLVDWVKVQIKN